jgi:hypothetical protein
MLFEHALTEPRLVPGNLFPLRPGFWNLGSTNHVKQIHLIAPLSLTQIDQPFYIIRLYRIFCHFIGSLTAAAETAMDDLKSFPGFLPQVDGLHQSLARVHSIPRQLIHVF